MQHFYDGQIRRYTTQMMRILSNFPVQDGDGQISQERRGHVQLLRCGHRQRGPWLVWIPLSRP